MTAPLQCAFEALLSASQAASLLSIHPNTLLLWARTGRMPSFRFGRRVSFRASEPNKWLEEHYTDVAVRAAQPERMAA
jgi:excisionase family DNA binding protein